MKSYIGVVDSSVGILSGACLEVIVQHPVSPKERTDIMRNPPPLPEKSESEAVEC